MWITILRRVTFVTGLLTIGPAVGACFHFAFNSDWSKAGGLTPAVSALGMFAWGADSLGFVLAAWLASRHQIWKTWSGPARAAMYVLVYSYGRMLFSATQNWLLGIGPDDRPWPPDTPPLSFRWPGANYQDYSYPAIDLMILLTLVWLLVPMFTVVRGELCEQRERPQARSTFSLFFLLLWTTIAAVILLWIRFLTWRGVAPQTSYLDLTATQALNEYVTLHLPSEAIVAVAVIVAAWAWSGRWWQIVIGLLAAFLIDTLGQNLVYAILKWTTGDTPPGTVFARSLLDQCTFVLGRTLIIWLAFGLAALTGVRLRWGTPGTNDNSAAQQGER